MSVGEKVATPESIYWGQGSSLSRLGRDKFLNYREYMLMEVFCETED